MMMARFRSKSKLGLPKIFGYLPVLDLGICQWLDLGVYQGRLWGLSRASLGPLWGILGSEAPKERFGPSLGLMNI